MSKSGRLSSILVVTMVLMMVHVAGAITVTDFFPVPTANSTPFWITLGPDGSLWFTEKTGNKIGRITTEGVIVEFPVPGCRIGLPIPYCVPIIGCVPLGNTFPSRPSSITTGPDGNLWFTSCNRVMQMSPAGAILNDFS